MRNILNHIDKFTEKEISYTQANEAYISSLMTIKNKEDAFYFLSSMNLLNSYVKKDYAQRDFAKKYKFKNYLLKGIEKLIKLNLKDVDIYWDKKVVYIEISGIQFSFHNIYESKAISRFKTTKENKYQEWKGIRLQPLASDIFEFAKSNYKYRGND
ncbi:hypothetical protein [Terrisporobacter mayombei]|uniref:hypothetical protein n=1 Tax=Terrisporobacter mayombei TaxID=1541 RepID=UPI002659DBA9|nr:hypothetical protein [Terrisporobacter mayombei]MCC3668896.1 hypothetical protein [Terrisporobacter mayombei]